MGSREAIITQLYNNYRFIEEDISDFRRIPCLSDVKNFKEGATKLSYYVLEEVKSKGFVETFKKVEEEAIPTEDKTPTDIAFLVLQVMCGVTDYHVKDEDINKLANDKVYKECFDNFLEENSITNVDELNKRKHMDLLKRVLTVRLEAIESEKKVNLYPGKLISEIVSVPKDKLDEYIEGLPEDDKRVIREREEAIKETNSKEIPMSDSIKFDQIVKQMKRDLIYDEEVERALRKAGIKSIYQMPYSKEKIKKAISTLSPDKQDLMKKREEGYPLSDEEKKQVNAIKNEIIKIIDKEMQEERKKPISSAKIKKKTFQQTPTINRNPSSEKQKSVSSNVIPEVAEENKSNNHINENKQPEEKLTIESIVERIEQKIGETLSIDEETAESIMNRLPDDVIVLLGKEVIGQELSPEEYKRVSNAIQITMNTRVTEVMQSARNWENIITEGATGNKYYVVAYKSINAEHSLIDKEIAKLPEPKRKLIERIGRISEGIFEKLLTPEENNNLQSTFNEIRSNLGLEIMPQEKPKNISKTVVTRYKDIASSVGMNPEEWAAVKEKLSDNDKRIIKEKEEGKVLNLVDKNRCVYLVNSLKKGIIPKERLKKTSIYEDTPYPKEEVDKLIEKLSDNDKRIIKEKEEGNKLNRTDNHRYHYLIKLLKQGKIPMEKKPKKEKIEETPAPQEEYVDLKKEGKTMPKESSKEKTKKSPISKKRGPHPKSIYELVPVPRQELDQYLTEELSDEELGIVTTREKLIRENRFDEIPKEYEPIIAEIVRKAKKRFGLNDNKPISMKTIIKNVKKLIKIQASNEEIEVVLGTLSSKDLELLNKKGSCGRLTSEKYLQRQVVIKKIESEIRKQRGQETPQEEKIEETPKTHKTSVERKKLQDYFPDYSKEKLAELIEKISDDDKELIKAMEEGKVLPRTDLNRYYRVIYALQKGRIPAPRTRRADRHLTVIETQEGKGYHVKESIYVLIPVDRDVLDAYIEKELDDDEKNIVRTRERIINEKSSERLTQWAYDKFARILKKIREALIPEEDRDEISKKVSQGKRIPIHKRFSSFSKEEIDAGIACLSEEEKELIEKSENGEPIPRCKRGKLRYALNKMEKILYKNRIQIEKTPISREQLAKELKQSKETDNQDVENTGEEQTTVPPEEIIPEPPTTAPQEIADDERIMADYSKGLLVAATKSAKVAERVGAINLAMISLRYGTVEGVPKRTSEEIAKFLEMDLETVEKTITDTLKEIYDVIVESLENNNTNSGKTFVKKDGETREE